MADVRASGRGKYIFFRGKVPPGETPRWLKTSDTIASLAEQVGIDPDALQATVHRFNRFAEMGSIRVRPRRDRWDKAWAADSQLVPGHPREAAFYANEVMGAALATKGRLRVNGFGEVL